jgi:26S proteasome regulatory subunit N1
MILLWDTDSGLAQLDKYLHSNDTHVVAGALLGIGVVTCGVKNDCDPVCTPLHYLLSSSPPPLALPPPPLVLCKICL